MVQHRAARFVCRDYERKSSVTRMLAEFDWDHFELRRQAARLTLLYKVTSDQVAIPASKFLTPVARPTRHNNSKAFQRPRAKKDCYKNSFFPRTISEWNLLPEPHQFQAGSNQPPKNNNQRISSSTCALTTLCVAS